MLGVPNEYHEVNDTCGHMADCLGLGLDCLDITTIKAIAISN